MRSKAAIGSHPNHPALVPIPIGSFFLALVGDVMHAAIPNDPFWYDLSFAAIGVGLISGVVAAAAGAIDYIGVKMSSAAFRLATVHAILNASALALYAISFILRRSRAAETGPSWPPAIGLEVTGFVLLGVSGWIGGKLAFEHHVGVVDAPAEPAGGSKRASAAP